MTVGEYVKIHAAAMEMLEKNGIRMKDFRYVQLYEDFTVMTGCGTKVSYTVLYLSAKYKVSPAFVYRLLKRFKHTV